jgi:aminopeptidase N
MNINGRFIQFKIIISFILCFLTAKITAQQILSFNQFDEIVQAEKKSNKGKFSQKNQIAYYYDVNYHRCFWKIDPAVNYISGNVTTYFKPETQLDTLLFDLSDSLSVDSIMYHQSSLAFYHSNNILSIILPSAIISNTYDSITIYYQGSPANTGFGSFMQSNHNGVPVIWTLSEAYGSSDWWPCKNSLTDKADSIDIFIQTSSEYKAASNGILFQEIISANEIIYHWKHRYPIATYLICLAVTDYAVYSDWVPFENTLLEVINYVYPEDSASILSQTDDIIPMMQLYDSLFGIYPFQNEKYGHAQFGWEGGMEHQSMSFMGSFEHELMAHELAHQWFGDKITCASWQDIWLNEGFATYLTGITYEHMFNGKYWPIFKQSRMDMIMAEDDGSVWCNDTTSLDRIFDGRLSYTKGAMILHQLRWVIGDSAFFTAVNNYLNDVNLAYGFARTSDLKLHFENSSGQNLDWYFDDWFTGEGYPDYQLDWIQNGNEINLTIYQTQSHSSVSFFELPLPIQFKNSMEDTLITVNHSFSGQSFTIDLSFTVDSLIFDPEIWLIVGNHKTSSIHTIDENNQIKIYPNPVKDILNIEGVTSNFQISIFDLAGKIICTEKNKHQIELKNISEGLYVAKINSSNYVSIVRLIKL